ncbi:MULTISPECIES: sporulation protein Cse60 [Paenibacillus]|uniref:Sporulation protein Cse60 n=1 Tax=Paenibacillus radicis (ex Xue et al. 2023) TaxID=2972489 RepID=A0ABT1YCF8_9BACL|nr:sporulation protein Cse60 [Paenibacillus radicis (ex Xue et al. 2023)]MCR8630877.1 sporulation protein Cse60 [Paenibacillus radicis (ex Xue et al. 2023)]
MKTKARLLAHYQEGLLENELNEFLDDLELNGGEIIDIKYSSAVCLDKNSKSNDGTLELYSVLVIYQIGI